MTWFMIERPSPDPARTAAWYAEHFRFELERVDETNGFYLLKKGTMRLALKKSDRADATILHFEVDDLRPFEHFGEIKVSDEGYRRVKFRDPDGRDVVVFQWV